MNIISVIRNLSVFEKILWFFSVISVSVSFALTENFDWLVLFASLVGVTALIFIAKGNVWGQILTIVFSLLYAVISYQFKYFGEMITYLGMTAPVAFLSVATWLKNPYSVNEVKVSELNQKKYVILFFATLIVTFIFHYILKILGNTNLFFSTISVATSFLASSLMTLRSPFYAIAYACNDLILIILWCLASLENISYIPMIICFFVFFINDLYGFKNWNDMKRKQRKAA